jgi:hypothetical protein
LSCIFIPDKSFQVYTPDFKIARKRAFAAQFLPTRQEGSLVCNTRKEPVWVLGFGVDMKTDSRHIRASRISSHILEFSDPLCDA